MDPLSSGLQLPGTFPRRAEAAEREPAPAQPDSVQLSKGGPDVGLSIIRPEKEWTLLFYNAGAGCESKMSTASLVDLERVGSDENTNVVAMNYRSPWLHEKFTGRHHEYLGARTYYVTKNENAADKLPLLRKALPSEGRELLSFLMSGPEDLKSPVLERHAPDVNMGDRNTLRTFLIDNMRKFPARHYAVILSGHGAAFGGSMIVHNPEGRIKNEELADVLKDACEKTGASIDLLDMNTCFSANTESLYPLKGTVKNVVASESTVFAATQPFSAALKDLQQGLREGREMTGRDLATLLVEESRRRPLGNMYTETLSALDMDKLGAVADAVSALQGAIMKEGVDPTVVREAYGKSTKIDYSSVPKQVYVTDAGSFADEVSSRTTSPVVRKAASALKSALGECVFAEEHARHEAESVTSRVMRIFLGAEKNYEGLSGLTVYYDDDAENPDSRLDQVQKTAYTKEGNAEEFLRYMSRKDGDGAPSLLGKIGRTHDKAVQKLSKATGIHHSLVSFASRIGRGLCTIAAFRGLGALGIPAYPLVFGSLFTVKGVADTVTGAKKAASLAGKPLTAADKGKMADHVSRSGVGLAMTSFGLYLLGVLPATVAWPAALAALAIRGGKELAKILVNRKDHQAFTREARRFAELPVADKLAGGREKTLTIKKSHVDKS